MNIALYLFWRVRVPPEFKNWKNAINPIFKVADKKRLPYWITLFFIALAHFMQQITIAKEYNTII